MIYLIFCFKLLLSKITNLNIYCLNNITDNELYKNITVENIENITNNNLMLISNNIYKKKLLHNLKNENISIINKLQLLNEYENTNAITFINLLNGGLLNDWNFPIENI